MILLFKNFWIAAAWFIELLEYTAQVERILIVGNGIIN